MAVDVEKQSTRNPIPDGQRPQPEIRERGRRAVEKTAKALERLEVVYVDVAELKPNSYNPNRQDPRDFELLVKSMTEDGFTQPIVAIRNERVIVDGEHRWRAARHLGYDKVPVVFVDMTMEQMRISTLRHNRARGSEDIALSAEVLRDLRELGALDWAQDSLMMEEEEMRILLDDIPVPEGLAGEDYSESWISSKSKESTVSVEAKQVDPQRMEASTQKVVEAVKLAEQKAALVDNESEKSKILFEIKKDIYRIAVSYTGDEAKIVKEVLGLQPAVKLVELCKKYEAHFATEESQKEEVING